MNIQYVSSLKLQPHETPKPFNCLHHTHYTHTLPYIFRLYFIQSTDTLIIIHIIFFKSKNFLFARHNKTTCFSTPTYPFIPSINHTNFVLKKYISLKFSIHIKFFISLIIFFVFLQKQSRCSILSILTLCYGPTQGDIKKFNLYRAFHIYCVLSYRWFWKQVVVIDRFCEKSNTNTAVWMYLRQRLLVIEKFCIL